MKSNPSYNDRRSPIRRSIEFIFYVVLFTVASVLVKELSRGNNVVRVFGFLVYPSTLKGILSELQMLISVYLVLRENKAGYVAAVILNISSIFVAVELMFRKATIEALSGVVSYSAVILILTLIMNCKKGRADYIKKIEDQKRIHEESEGTLQNLAFYDALTGLPNKKLFISRLNLAIQNAKENSSLIGVFFIDLDSFKSVNDTMGHTAGDYLLRQMADRLSSCLNNIGTLARFGGDEFLIQVIGIEKMEALYIISDTIMGVLNGSIAIQEFEYYISASAGVAVYPLDGEDPEALIKNADLAMYSAKSKGKGQCIFCSPELKDNIAKKVKLTNGLFKALDQNELFLDYQPQINAKTGEITGLEALLRWNNKEYGVVPPAEFIPIAEKTGLIKPIGLWVLQSVCAQYKSCRDRMNRDLRIAVNISIEQLKDANMITEIRKILDGSGTAAESIQIEITESAAFNEEPFILRRIHELKNLGFSVAIDDFGTGHSSFSRLKAFPIDTIKIDMEFVHGISSVQEKDKAIIKSIIQISKNLGIEVLAEGVETEKQFQYLREEKCDIIQGNYFYRPMPAEDINSILTAQCPKYSPVKRNIFPLKPH